MRIVAAVAQLLLVACARPPAPPPLPPLLSPQLAPPVIHSVMFETVWSAASGTLLEVGRGEPLVLPYAFQALDVVGRDSAGLIVRCTGCSGRPVGRVEDAAVVRLPLPPEIAARRSLGDFALAIREAARRRDLQALRVVMAPDFSFSFVGIQSPDAAFAVWQAEAFATLDHVPDLLDQGLASTDGAIWSAPPAFVEDPSYRGLRLGFRRRPDGVWEWVYLIRGIVG